MKPVRVPMAKTYKKVISTFISLTTIAWSVGVGSLALPNVASAATLNAGDLIKASGPALYYYGADAKRYVFPNEKTYFSWYTDFSSVKTISDAELAAITIGSNVTIRPGTKLVKITTDLRTYAVSKCGVLHWIESETVAKALYGDAWNTRIVDVPDGFFVNYTVGSSVATNVHPDGQVVTYSGDTSKYVVWNGAKRMFSSDAAYAANMLNPAYDVMTTITYGNGSEVTGREADLADVVCGAGSVVGGALTAALASDTPAGMNVPKNASSVPLVKVNFTAGTGDVVLTGLRFHRVGVGAASDFANVYLYDANGKRLTTGRTVNSSSNTVEFNSLNVTITAGQTWSALVYGDFSSPASTGGQHAFELVDAASVVVGGNSTVGGAYPVRGNVFTVGTTMSARVDVTKGAKPSNPVIGTKGAEVSNFKLTANTNDVKINQVTLYQAGSITNSDLTNLKLMQGTTEVASAASVSSDGRIVLKFANPYLIANGTTKVFSLKADIGGRADRTIKTYVEYTTDVTAIDQVYSAGAAVCITSAGSVCTTGSFDGNSASSDFIEVTTQGGQLTNAYNGPPTSNVAKGQLAVPLYNFTLTSPDNALEIKNIRVSIAKTAGSAGTCYVKGSSGTNYFRSIKIKNLDTGATVMGPTELASGLGNSATGSGTITFTDSFNINAGQTMNLALVADLSNSQDEGAGTGGFLDGACAYQATFQAFQSNDVRVVDTGEFLDITKVVPNSTVLGNALTVKASRLDVALASQPVSDTLVKKQQNVPVAGLVLTASAESDITVTSLTLAGQSDRTTAGCAGFGGAACNLAGLSQRVTSLALYDGDTQVGLAKAPDTTTGKAQISNMNLVVPKGTSKILTIKASLSSTASSTSPYDKIAVGMASANDMSAQDQDSNTVTPTLSAGVTGQVGATPAVAQTIIPNGTLTIQADAHPASTIVVAGKDAWVPLAQYKATAQYEQIDLDRIAVYATPTSGLSADNADFALIAVAQDGAVKGSGVLSSGATGTKDIDLSGNKVMVAKGGTATFQLWAKLSSVQASSSVNGVTTGVARSGHAPALGLNSSLVTGEWDANYAGKLNVRAIGNASGERVYAATGAAHGNSMVLRKTLPIVTKQSLSSTTLTNTSQQDLIKFQVAADANGSIAFKQVIFNLSKSGVSLSNFRLRRGTTDVPDADVNIVFASSTGLNVVDAETGTLAETTQDSGKLIVSFTGEETMSGAGNVYTLYAGVSGAGSGDNVTVSFYRAPSTAIVTGYLVNSVADTGLTLPASASIYHIDTGVGVTGAYGASGSFLWSDNSEVPHSSAVGSSRDWTNDVYVQDVSQSQTISL
ncbi:MAG: hypothetical protein ABIB04_00755 [Patescibacteria group bacterium]